VYLAWHFLGFKNYFKTKAKIKSLRKRVKVVDVIFSRLKTIFKQPTWGYLGLVDPWVGYQVLKKIKKLS